MRGREDVLARPEQRARTAKVAGARRDDEIADGVIHAAGADDGIGGRRGAGDQRQIVKCDG